MFRLFATFLNVNLRQVQPGPVRQECQYVGHFLDRLVGRLAGPMARAGFDPQAAVSLWDKMHAESPARPPQWLSTHPDPERRRDRLAAQVETLRAARDPALARPALVVLESWIVPLYPGRTPAHL